jgi:integrase
MPKRSRKGAGSVEKIGTGAAARYRARVSRTIIVGGETKRVRESKVFAANRDAWAWIAEQLQSAPTAVATHTVASWLTEWLVMHKGEVQPKSYAGDEHTCKRYLVPALGPRRLRDLTSLHVTQWLAQLKADGTSDSERKKAGSCLRKALNAAVRHKALSANPCDDVRLPTPQREEKKVMTREHLEACVRAADTMGIGYAIRLWADAGLRPAEMFALHWDDIDFTAGKVTIRRALDGITNKPKTPKTAGSRRTIPLSASTLEALAEAKHDGCEVVLPNEVGGYLWASNFADVFRRLMKAAKLESYGYDRYTFRHTMASLLLSSGVNILVVSRRLGHAKVTQTLDTYAHLMPDDAAKAAEIMGSILPSLGPR